MLHCVAACPQCVVVCCRVLQCVANNVLQSWTSLRPSQFQGTLEGVSVTRHQYARRCVILYRLPIGNGAGANVFEHDPETWTAAHDPLHPLLRPRTSEVYAADLYPVGGLAIVHRYHPDVVLVTRINDNGFAQQDRPTSVVEFIRGATAGHSVLVHQPSSSFVQWFVASTKIFTFESATCSLFSRGLHFF